MRPAHFPLHRDLKTGRTETGDPWDGGARLCLEHYTVKLEPAGLKWGTL